MSRTKTKHQTKHALTRAYERLGVPEKIAVNMMKRASSCGLSPSQLPEGPVRDVLMNKETRGHKRIKVYKGNVYVFNKNSNRCITVYKLDLEEKEGDKDDRCDI